MTEPLWVTVLVEDTAVGPAPAPRHGLALLVEYGEGRVLFDTGPDEAVVTNARSLGVDLGSLTAIVLSHGHYDHTGGLAPVLAAVAGARVIAHPEACAETFADGGQAGLRYIGAPLAREDYERQGACFELSEEALRVGEGLVTTGEVAQTAAAAATGSRFLRRGREGLRPDDYRDDLSLVALLEDCSVVITGCAHAGLLNILRQAEAVAPGRPPRVVLGGLHLLAASDEAVAALGAEAYARGVRTLLPGHCTGERAVQVLQAEFPGAVIPITTGTRVRIDQDGSPTLMSCLRAERIAG